MAGRIPRVSTTLKRTLAQLGVGQQSARYRALFATVKALSHDPELPGPADFVASFHPGYVNVRRVAGFNLWILYRFGPTFLDVVAVRDQPPSPIEQA